MKVRELMTANPTCCSADTGLGEIARQMVECDCGMIPIVDGDGRALGTVTDRDIVCRALAEDKNPLDLSARDVMSRPVVTVREDAELEEVAHLLEEQQIRRIVVAGEDGRCVGVIAQADLARATSDDTIAEILREVSRAEGHAAHLS